MSDKHKDCRRKFTQLSKAWYGKACLAREDIFDSITMGFYHPEGGTTGEFSIVWKMVGSKWTPRLQAFEDSWDALYHFDDVIKKLAEFDGKNPEPDEIVNMLESCGISNATNKTQ